MSAILFEHSVKSLKPLKGFKPALDLSLIKSLYFSSYASLAYRKTLSASDSDLLVWIKRRICNSLYGWSGIFDQFGLCSFVSSFVSFYYVVTFNFFLVTY